MIRRLVCLISVLAWPALASAIDIPSLDAVDFGGRFDYVTRIDRDTEPFTWDAADRARLMLEGQNGHASFGDFYVKGAAYWGEVGAVAKRLRFEQADYYWARGGDRDTLRDQPPERSAFGFRLFANERRFFVRDRIAPLVTDDGVGESGDNRGVRLDAVRHGLELSALYAVLGERTDAPRVGYARTAYTGFLGTVSASYRIDDLQERASRNRSTVKAGYAVGYRRAYVALAYEQTGFDTGDLFFPRARLAWDRLDGLNISHVLPEGGALFTEFRIAPLRTGSFGEVKLVYRYQASGSEFVSDAPQETGSGVGHTASMLFRATQYNLSGRLRYHRVDRYRLESDKRDIVDLDLFGVFANGLEVLSRARYEHVDDRLVSDDRNVVHLAVTRRESKMRAGAHVMWKDIDRDLSETLFAFDGKFALTPDLGFHWRFVFGEDGTSADAIFARIEYRPSNRIFATFDYGHAYIGDGPFLLEDSDIGLQDVSSAVYTLSLRGDF